MKEVPAGYHRLAGSERQPMPNARLIGPADPGEIISVSIHVRRRREGPVIPVFSRPGEQRRVSREEFAELYGAHPADLDRVAGFCPQSRPHGHRE